MRTPAHSSDTTDSASAIAAARGVYKVVCETMAGAVRAHAADRGADHREEEGRNALMEAGAQEDDVVFEYSADMRYSGQQFELLVSLGARPDPHNVESKARQLFEAQYLKVYKLILERVPVEVLNWRMTASAPAHGVPDLGSHGTSNCAEGRVHTRRVHLWRDNQEVAVMPRAAIKPGDTVAGPMILEEAETTLVVPPGWSATLGALGCVVATRPVTD